MRTRPELHAETETKNGLETLTNIPDRLRYQSPAVFDKQAPRKLVEFLRAKHH